MDRYHRQKLLPGFGESGQAKLAEASVLIMGCGALGTVLAESLCRAGVGKLIIVDRDYVEWTNLQRQVLFDENDAQNAMPKAIAAQSKLQRINAGVCIEAHVDDLNHTNILTYAGINQGQPVDLLVDGLDNFETRYLANDVAVKHGIPYIYGGAVGTVGTLMPVLPHTESSQSAWEQAGVATPCLQDVFDEMPMPGLAGPTCDTAGVLGPGVSTVAQLQAAEAIKVLLGAFDAVNTSLRHLDFWHNTVRDFNVANAYDQARGHLSKASGFAHLNGEHATGTTTICGRNAVQLRLYANHAAGQTESQRMDLAVLAEKLQPLGSVVANAHVVRVQLQETNDDGEPMGLTVFADGRAMVHGTKKPAVAKALCARLIGM